MCLSVANKDQLASETNDKSSTSSETSPSVEDVSSTVNASINEVKTEVPNGSPSRSSQSPAKRSSLTARERLRAARVRNRSPDTKAPKPEMGSKVLAALRGSDGGKMRSGLPEAPSNMLDDSKRGMPKQGLTFDFPGGADLFFIVLSFVLITTLMLATTFVVWKVGAIHFNEWDWRRRVSISSSGAFLLWLSIVIDIVYRILSSSEARFDL